MNIHKILNILIAAVWLINGLFCKLLNLVPRHEAIVARILNLQNARPVTILIGIAEIVMATWILSGKESRINAIVQVIIIAVMNSLEFIMAPAYFCGAVGMRSLHFC